MTALVTLSKVANVSRETWEGEGFTVTFYDESYSAVVMNNATGFERTLILDEEIGIYGDQYFIISFMNGVPVLDLIAYDDVEYSGE